MSLKAMAGKTVTLLAIAIAIPFTTVNCSQPSTELTAQETTKPPSSQAEEPSDPLIRTLSSTSEATGVIATAQSGKLLASANRTKPEIKLWDVTAGQIKTTLAGHTGGVRSLALSPDGNILISAGEDKTIKLWNANTGQLIRTLTGHSQGVNTVALSQDGTLLASGSQDKTIKLWNAKTGVLIRTLTGHTDSVLSLAISPDRTTLASTSQDETLRIWNLGTGKLEQTHKDGGSPYPGFITYTVSAVAISPDGKFVASASIDDVSKGHIEGNTIRIRNLQTGEVVRSIAAGSGTVVNTIAFTPDGETLIASVGEVKLWNLKTGELLRTLTTFSDAIALSDDGQILFSADNPYGQDSQIRVWDTSALTASSLNNAQLLGTIDSKTTPARDDSLAISPKGQPVVTCSGSQVKAWNPWNRSSNPLLYSVSLDSFGCAIAISPDGKTLAVSSRTQEASHVVKLLDINTGRVKTTLSKHNDTITALAFSPDGNTLVSSGGGQIKVWNLPTGDLRYALTEGISWGDRYSVAVTPNGQTLYVGYQPQDLALYDLQTGKPQNTLPVQIGGKLHFTPDGKALVGQDLTGKVVLLNAQTGELLSTLLVDRVNALALSEDGKIATDTESGLIKLWDVSTGNLLHTFGGHSGPVDSLAFSENGKVLTSFGSEGMLKFWSIPEKG
jgi:WD40 repeat protein